MSESEKVDSKSNKKIYIMFLLRFNFQCNSATFQCNSATFQCTVRTVHTTGLPPSMPRPVSYSGSYVDPTSATDCTDTTVGPNHVIMSKLGRQIDRRKVGFHSISRLQSSLSQKISQSTQPFNLYGDQKVNVMHPFFFRVVLVLFEYIS